MTMVVLYKGLFLADVACANNVRISGEPDVQLNATSDSLQLKFTLSWDNSWRDDFNWDAVWLFVKYRKEGSNDAWSHLYLSPDQSGTANLEIDPGNTGDKIVGAFVYPKNSGAFNINGEQVVLKAPLNGLSASDITNQKIYFAVEAIEMVLIPYGPYYLGDGFSHHTFRSVPTRIIPADADVIGTDPTFSYSCIPSYWTNGTYSALPEGAADRRNNSRWESPYSHICCTQESAYNTSWTVNFGAPKIIRTFGVSFAKYVDSGGNYYPTENWYLLGSLDSLSWDTLSRCRISDAIAENISYPVRHAIRVEHPGSYQYYRLFFPEVNDGRYGFMITNVAMSEQDLYPDASDNYYVDSEDAIPYGEALDGLYVDDGITWSGSLPAAYPKGYKGFYMMKYELSQEQYVNFLNMLSYPQQKNRIGNNLDHLHRGDYVFGDPAHPSCRNGIAVFSHKGSSQPVVFGNNLNPADPFFAGDDGQTLACNYLTGPDMLAYLDWSGLRPLSELEYEKACRTPDRSLAGEYAWNTTAIHHLGGQSGLSASTMGTENEIPSELSVNANAGNVGFGPVRCGSFGSNTSNQQQSGASFYGVMELSGNLGEMCYSVLGGSGLNVSSSNNEYHGDGVIASDGNHNVSGYWNGSSATGMLSIRGGSFASADSLLRVSDRSVLMDYDNGLRDSTVTFRGGRSIGKSVDPGEIVCNHTCPGLVTVSSIQDAVADCDLRYSWYVKRPGALDYELIAGETGPELRDFEVESVGVSATVTYIFRRKVAALTGEAFTEFVLTVPNMFWQITPEVGTINDCGFSTELIASSVVSGADFEWSYNGTVLSSSANFLPLSNHFGGLTGELFIKCTTSRAGCRDEKSLPLRIASGVIIASTVVTIEDCSVVSFRDSRDGQVYCTVKIGDQCWMGRNLNYGTMNATKYCYNDQETNCDIYGGLYTWAMAMSNGEASNIGVQGICPEGWHIPTPEEWNILYTNWRENWNIQKGGHWVYSQGSFISLNSSGAWWATQIMGAYAAYASGGGAPRADYDYWSGAVKGPLDRNSIRCIKD